jgi:hypothetical protein
VGVLLVVRLPSNVSAKGSREITRLPGY